jgi:hypothetical protein
MISIPRTLGILLVVASGCKVSSVEPMTFPATYRPEGAAGAVTVAPACAVVHELDVVDGRSDKSLVGARSIQDKDARSDVLIEGDIEAWLRAAISRGLVQGHFPQEEGADLDLRFELESIQIDEVAYRNSTYEGRVILGVEIVNSTTGDAIWSHRADGVSTNYGRPGNPTNYQETINHALDRAVARALNEPALRDALCAESP